MRAVEITVHNNQTLEVFVEKLQRGFELWAVGPIKGRRVVIYHHLTYDDLEALLEYAEPGDLKWQDAGPSEIPAEKHQSAIEEEKTIEQGRFSNYQAIDQSVALPIVGAINFLQDDKNEVKSAKAVLLGRWTDRVAKLTLEPDHRMQLASSDRQHPLARTFVGDRGPDWWNFAMWGLALLDNERKIGMTTSVLRVNEQELHILSTHPHRLAHVFHRVGGPSLPLDADVLTDSSSTHSQARRNRSAGNKTSNPLLSRLEEAIAARSPLLAERLNDGLLEADIRAALSEAGVEGNVEPIVQLYAWRNGTAPDENASMDETSFFPVDIYQFMDLPTAIGHRKDLLAAAEQLVEMMEGTEAEAMFSDITGSLFPLFTDGSTGTIAVDVAPGNGNRVVEVEFESEEPVRQLYGSFDAFLEDAIRANEEDDSLAAFQAK